MQERPIRPLDLPITFSNAYYKGIVPHQDDPMVVLIVTTKYKVEWVLVNQGSSTNIFIDDPLMYKYLIGDRMGVVRADQHVAKRCYKDNPCLDQEDVRLQSREDLKEVHTGPKRHHKTTIGGFMDTKTEEKLIQLLTKNRDAFAWSLKDMPKINPDFLCHRLSITPRMRLMCQKKRRLGDEKRRTVKEETTKLLHAWFMRSQIS
ncbi:hypothetical protein CR513_47742, partial [Mucuna pruriens]